MIKPDVFIVGPFAKYDLIMQSRETAWQHLVIEAAAQGLAIDYPTFKIELRGKHSSETGTTIRPEYVLQAQVL